MTNDSSKHINPFQRTVEAMMASACHNRGIFIRKSEWNIRSHFLVLRAKLLLEEIKPKPRYICELYGTANGQNELSNLTVLFHTEILKHKRIFHC